VLTSSLTNALPFISITDRVSVLPTHVLIVFRPPCPTTCEGSITKYCQTPNIGIGHKKGPGVSSACRWLSDAPSAQNLKGSVPRRSQNDTSLSEQTHCKRHRKSTMRATHAGFRLPHGTRSYGPANEPPGTPARNMQPFCISCTLATSAATQPHTWSTLSCWDAGPWHEPGAGLR
jgi:hypothetical protein